MNCYILVIIVFWGWIYDRSAPCAIGSNGFYLKLGQIITSFTCVGQGLFDCYFRFEHLTDGLGFDDILLNFDDWLPVLYDVGV